MEELLKKLINILIFCISLALSLSQKPQQQIAKFKQWRSWKHRGWARHTLVTTPGLTRAIWTHWAIRRISDRCRTWDYPRHIRGLVLRPVYFLTRSAATPTPARYPPAPTVRPRDRPPILVSQIFSFAFFFIYICTCTRHTQLHRKSTCTVFFFLFLLICKTIVLFCTTFIPGKVVYYLAPMYMVVEIKLYVKWLRIRIQCNINYLDWILVKVLLLYHVHWIDTIFLYVTQSWEHWVIVYIK